MLDISLPILLPGLAFRLKMARLSALLQNYLYTCINLIEHLTDDRASAIVNNTFNRLFFASIACPISSERTTIAKQSNAFHTTRICRIKYINC